MNACGEGAFFAVALRLFPRLPLLLRVLPSSASVCFPCLLWRAGERRAERAIGRGGGRCRKGERRLHRFLADNDEEVAPFLCIRWSGGRNVSMCCRPCANEKKCFFPLGGCFSLSCLPSPFFPGTRRRVFLSLWLLWTSCFRAEIRRGRGVEHGRR